MFEATELARLAEFADEVGVISLYATVEPGSALGQTRMRSTLTALRRDLAEHADRDWAARAEARLTELEQPIADLLDPTEPGLGRMMFAQIGGDAVHTAWIQRPVGEVAVVEANAYLWPLLAAIEPAPPAGVARVGRDGVRLFDCRYGLAEELTSVSFNLPGTPSSGEQRADVPTLSRAGIHPDRFPQRVEEHLTKHLRQAAGTVTEHVRQRGWHTLVLAGDPRLTRILAEALPPEPDRTELDAVLDPDLTPTGVLDFVTPTLAEARTRRESAAVQRVADLARAGGNGVLGLADTISMLQAGRVERLLLDAAGGWSPEDAVDAGAPPTAVLLAGEGTASELAEGMVELALSRGGAVTLLDSAAVDDLADSDGIAALLRW
ncbi:VLRF1 family aeRF1-type release factor [Actinocatenispora thailandica]|nr:VLRF1 family aeRF1-type release factor [Actinocatenispora thailandica]